jgi:hypothetical protein
MIPLTVAILVDLNGLVAYLPDPDDEVSPRGVYAATI